MRGKKVAWIGWVVSCGISAQAWGQDPDWSAMSVTLHSVFQAVDANGSGTFSTTVPVKMQGVLLNRPSDMIDATPGANPYMGGQWQCYMRPVDATDFGGTALYMGQNIGRNVGNHPAGSYTDAEWLAELDRLDHDPATGRAFRPGDLVEVHARAPGLFYRGKTNVNEQHLKVTEANFDVVLLQAQYGLPSPQVVTLSDLKDASDQFIFDQKRATGCEHYQGSAVRINGVSFASTTNWKAGGQLTIQDGAGHTFPVLLGLGDGFTRYEAPTGSFDIVAILDQEDSVGTDGYKAGYRLWVMNYDGEEFVLYRYVKPDFDHDGDVDDDDAGHFKSCALGPGVPQTTAECLDADFDGDADNDQADFAVLQRCWSGTQAVPDPTCD
jgi:hypothetical protein